MSDAYEAFFFLDPTNAADGALHYDGDILANSNEAPLWTDPWVADTDRDGLHDDLDSNSLSRAYIAWGEPAYTVSNSYFYTGPRWWLSAAQSGGIWTTGPPAWLVSALQTNDLGSLLIEGPLGAIRVTSLVVRNEGGGDSPELLRIVRG